MARTVFGDGARGPQWAEARCTELLEHGADAILARLAELHLCSSEAAEVVRRERGYFTANRQRMRYPEFRATGLPIGSGAVESSAKHLVQQRLKRPGARWSDAGARAILTLRAHHLTQRTADQYSRLSPAA